jgi:4-diphosphocytidyl-2-C-methyl-D-erythritol kinase
MAALTLLASAKINLDLRIVGRRADGFHELRTIFQSLALHDVLTVRAARGPFRLEGVAPGLPLDRSNLAWRAAEAAWHAAGNRGRVRGVTIALEKHVPAAAGLGGGSSDAASTLVAVNRVLRLGLSPADLHRLAAGLGSDVPFFLLGGTALGLGRGEDLYPLPDLPPHHVVLVRPPFGVNTADAYRWFSDLSDLGSDSGQSQRGQTLTLPWRAAGLRLQNDLEAAVLPRHPKIAGARRALLRRGAVAALMAGSGSTVFGLFQTADAARTAAAALARPGWTVIVTRTLTRQAHVRRLSGLVSR